MLENGVVFQDGRSEVSDVAWAPPPRRVGAQDANSARGWQCDLASDSRALAQEGTWVGAGGCASPSVGLDPEAQRRQGVAPMPHRGFWSLLSQEPPQRDFLSPKDPRACCPPPSWAGQAAGRDSRQCGPVVSPDRGRSEFRLASPQFTCLSWEVGSWWYLSAQPAGVTTVWQCQRSLGGGAGAEEAVEGRELGQGVHPACVGRREPGVELGRHPHLTPRDQSSSQLICYNSKAQGQGRSPNLSWGWGDIEGGVPVGVSLDSESQGDFLWGAWPPASPRTWQPASSLGTSGKCPQRQVSGGVWLRPAPRETGLGRWSGL